MNIPLTVIDHPMPGHNVDDRIIVDDLGHKVAVVLPGLSSDERDQMAALFAAAPDLYAACKAAETDNAVYGNLRPETAESLSAALRKAVPQ